MNRYFKILLLFFCTILVAATPSEYRYVGSTKELLELEVLTLDIINKYRTKKGLTDLNSITLMQDLAREHSLKIAQGVRAFGHGGWDDRADEIFDKIEVEMVAENVGFNKGYDDPVERVFDGWIKSNTHRENILNEDFDITGIGVARSDEGVYYFTQIFASYFE